MTIIGNSPKITELLRTVERIAANTSLNTLILGENGSGKEMFARLLHQKSPNSDRPFVDIHCGAIPESLLESELFGHEKGAFTGAVNIKKGLFELARGGTVFLDEIANTSLNFQNKLLKAVENKRFRRIGGIEEITVSTRIIAATNIDMEEAVRQGKFREDLYYRLNVAQIYIPPLRERADDAVLLAYHFLEECNHEYGKEVKGIRPEALDLIRKYPWPGNVRQLRNTIERAVLIESEDWIEADDLNLDFKLDNLSDKEKAPKQPVTGALGDVSQFRFPTQGIALEELERGIISSALQKAGGNLSHAARLLRITRGKLRYRLEKLGLDV